MVISTIVSIPGVSFGLGLSSWGSFSFSLSRPLAIDSVVASVGVAIVSTVVSTIVSKTISTVVSIPGISFSLSLSSRGSFSRPLAIDSVVGVAIVSTVVSAVVSKTMSPVVSMTISTVVSIPGISFSLGFSLRGSLSFSRSLADVMSIVTWVAIVASVMMSKTVVASIKKIRISLWIGNCLCFSFGLAHGEDGQAEKSQNPDHPADAEVGWKCPMYSAL